MRSAGLELAGAQGRKETRNNQGKIQTRPGVGSGHGALQAELRLCGGGFLGVDGALALLPVSLWQGIGVAGAEALPETLSPHTAP